MYKFREVILENGHKKLVIELENKSMELVSAFLTVEMNNFGDYIKEALDSVLVKNEEYSEFEGNVYGLIIRKESTEVNDTLNEDAGTCVINTVELNELVNIFYSKLKELKEKEIRNL